VFLVYGEWECPESTVLSEDQRLPRDWRILDNNRRKILFIDDTDRAKVDKLTAWFAVRSKAKVFDEIDFDRGCDGCGHKGSRRIQHS
jgi:hypothetical protein